MLASLSDTPAPVSLQQSAGFARALTAIGTPPMVLPDGILVLQRRFGPVPVRMIARATVTGSMLNHLRDSGARGPVILSPEHALDRKRVAALPLVSPTHTAILDLSTDSSTLRSALHQKWRNRLKHAEKQSLRVTRQTLPDWVDHWLLQAEALQQRVHGYRSWHPALTCAFTRENPGDAKLFTAHLGREPVAGLLVLRHGNTATYHIGHTRPAGRARSAQCLLMWQAMLWLQRKGVARFDLGHVDTEEGAGLARFKLGTGANVQTLGGTWVWWPPVTRLLRPLGRLDRRLMSVC